MAKRSEKKMSTWLKSILFLASVAALVMLGLFAFSVEMPKNPALDRIQMQQPAPKWPINPKLRALMVGPSKAKVDAKEQARLYGYLRTTKRWLKDPVAAVASIPKSFPGTALFEQALEVEGCPMMIPDQQPKDPKKRVGFVRYLQGAKGLALRVLSLSQRGKPDDAAKILSHALKRVGQQTLDGKLCRLTLLSVMVGISARETLLKASVFPLVHARLSPASRDALLAAIKQVEAFEPNPMPDAHRGEYAYFSKLFDAMLKGKSKYSGLPAVRAWPWWDAELTKKWALQLAKSQVYKSMQPYGPKFWALGPEDRFLQKIQDFRGPRFALQKNSIGLILLAVSRPAYRRFALRWHQSRCYAAAHRSMLLDFYRKQGRGLPKGALAKAANPLTGKAFAWGKKLRLTCGIARKKPRVQIKGQKLFLPPWPIPGAQAPAVSPRPGAPAPKAAPAAKAPAARSPKAPAARSPKAPAARAVRPRPRPLRSAPAPRR